MSKLVSPRVSALRRKLRENAVGGKYFSGEEIDGLIRELTAIASDAQAMEDAIACQRRAGRPVGTPPGLAMPVGTFFFVPAGAQ